MTIPQALTLFNIMYTMRSFPTYEIEMYYFLKEEGRVSFCIFQGNRLEGQGLEVKLERAWREGAIQKDQVLMIGEVLPMR